MKTNTEGDNSSPKDEDKDTKIENTPSYIKAINLLGDSIEVFKTPKNEPYFLYNNGSYKEAIRVDSGKLSQIANSTYFKETRRTLNSEAKDRLKDYYSALAYEKDSTHAVYQRVACIDDSIYYDLGGSSGEVVTITSSDWKVGPPPEGVYFRRENTMLESPKPHETEGDLNLLKNYLNLSSDEDWYLIASSILASLHKSPFPIIIHEGEHGTGKTTKAKMIAQIIDPSTTPVCAVSSSQRDMFIAAQNSYLITYDNLSGIRSWMADVMCILSTGGSFRIRKLQTNDEESIFDESSPQQLTGIDNLTERGDLASRAIVIKHKIIPTSQRRTEESIWSDFNNDLPKIMGGVFNGLSLYLRNKSSVHLPYLPRMADFAILGAATADSFGATPDQFINAYNKNLSEVSKDSLYENPIASALIDFLNTSPLCVNNEWLGTMSNLRTQLLSIIPVDQHNSRSIPSGGQGMANLLKRLAPSLRKEGVFYEAARTSRSRSYRFFKQTISCDSNDGSDA